MTQKERIKKIVDNLYYPVCIGGSGVMVMHGIEREMGDLDVFMATQDWFKFWERFGWELITTSPFDPKRRQDPPYLEETLYDLKVNVFFGWRMRDIGNIDLNKVWRDSVLIDGVRCQTLQATLEWKMETRREKDIPDILAILQSHPELIVRG